LGSFFDALGIEYQYEVEGFDFGEVRYLPDFRLPKYKAWVEIKGNEPTHQEKVKAVLLATKSQNNIFVTVGEPWIVTLDKWIEQGEGKWHEYKMIGFWCKILFTFCPRALRKLLGCPTNFVRLLA
jgi:hypothetical protein